jgi:hypothetical protein
VSRRPVKRRRDGSFDVRFDDDVRDLLRSLPAQLRDLLTDSKDGPAARRLFPPAYTDEPELEAEYQRYMASDLVDRRIAALESMERTIDAERLDEEELTAWLATLHDFRIALGTALGVTEETFEQELDPNDPQLPSLAMYEFLTFIEHELVEALTDALPPARPDE